MIVTDLGMSWAGVSKPYGSAILSRFRHFKSGWNEHVAEVHDEVR
jgi:hypothetical protein